MSLNTHLCGFPNLGNTCYMNSTLQALLTSNVLNTSLMIYLKKNQQSIKNMAPIIKQYCKIIVELINNKPNIYSVRQFKKTLDIENQWFRGTSQHDSNEFMVYLINEMTDEKYDVGVSKLIKNICFGRYKQYIKCAECKNVNTSYFKFLDVQLPIPDKQNPDLEDCFIHFAQNETLDNTNKWMCPVCNKKVVSYKRMEIEDVPDVAIFTFNRFRGMRKNNKQIKIYEHIELEGKKLKLISTVNHYGGVGGGHYVAHVSKNNVWYRADDSRISKINGVGQLLNDPSIYMVVYQIDI
jgi:ubiquitin C-terminal hydrolase